MAINIRPAPGGTYNVPGYGGILQAGQALGGGIARVAQNRQAQQMQEAQAAQMLQRLLLQETGKDTRQQAGIDAQLQAGEQARQNQLLDRHAQRVFDADKLKEQRGYDARLLSQEQAYANRDEISPDDQDRALRIIAGGDQSAIQGLVQELPGVLTDEQTLAAHNRQVPANVNRAPHEIEVLAGLTDDADPRIAGPAEAKLRNVQNVGVPEGAVNFRVTEEEAAAFATLASSAYGPGGTDEQRAAVLAIRNRIYGNLKEQQETQLVSAGLARQAIGGLIDSLESVGVPLGFTKDAADQEQFVSQLILAAAMALGRGANFTIMEKLLTGKTTGVSGIESLSGRVLSNLRESPEDIIPRIRHFSRFLDNMERGIAQPGYRPETLEQSGLDYDLRSQPREKLEQMLTDPEAPAEVRQAIMKIIGGEG